MLGFINNPVTFVPQGQTTVSCFVTEDTIYFNKKYQIIFAFFKCDIFLLTVGNIPALKFKPGLKVRERQFIFFKLRKRQKNIRILKISVCVIIFPPCNKVQQYLFIFFKFLFCHKSVKINFLSYILCMNWKGFAQRGNKFKLHRITEGTFEIFSELGIY